MQSRRALIALLTDFGTRDPYVAAVKGVVRRSCDAEILDLSHGIAPYDRLEAAAFLHGVLPWLPSEGEHFERVVVLCVVDPGVGSERRIAVAHEDGRWLVAPDNGILGPVVPSGRAVLLDETPWDLPEVSRTFHGRDRFAPLVAALARGEHLPGDPGALHPLDAWPPIEEGESFRTGTVIAIDRFGNCVTDLDARLAGVGTALTGLPGGTIDRWAATYADMSVGEPCLLIGSRGTIEVSLREASAADLLQISRGDRVRIERVE